eukprot:2558913-Pyramimonas_sp.AAC.1
MLSRFASMSPRNSLPHSGTEMKREVARLHAEHPARRAPLRGRSGRPIQIEQGADRGRDGTSHRAPAALRRERDEPCPMMLPRLAHPLPLSRGQGVPYTSNSG